MPATIAYAPPADMSNTLMGQLGPSLELAQKLQTNKIQQQLLQQGLQQGAQEFPLQLQRLQAGLDAQKQQLDFANQTMPDKVKQEAYKTIDAKNSADRMALLLDTSRQLQPYQVASAKADADLAATQARWAGPNAMLDVASKGLKNIGEGITNQMQSALANVQPKLLNEQVKGADLGNQQLSAQIKQMTTHLELSKVSEMQDMMQKLKMVNPDLRLAALGDLPKREPETFGVFKDHPELLNDNNLLSVSENLDKQIAGNKDMQMLISARKAGVDLGQKFGLVMGSNGQPVMGLTNDYAQNLFKGAWKDVVKQSTSPEPTPANTTGSQRTQTPPATPGANATVGPKTINSYYTNMKKIDAIGDDTFSRSLYHATQQTALDSKGPISGTAADPRFMGMINTQPLSGILSSPNNYVSTSFEKNGVANGGLHIDDADKGLFTKYMNGSLGLGDKSLYDPTAKPSQVLAFRSGLDYLARSVATPSKVEDVGADGTMSFSDNDNVKAPDPFKVLQNHAFRSKLTDQQNSILDGLAVQKGWATYQNTGKTDDKGNAIVVAVYDSSPNKTGVAANFNDNEEP